MGETLKSLEFFLKYGFITVPVILWMLWAIYNWQIFHTKNDDKFDDACIRRLNWLKQDRWSGLYINWLGALLDKVSAVIGDAGQGGESWLSRILCNCFGFDHNPWTEPSFNLLFRIALVYPLLSFIVFWLMGGSGHVGSVELLPDNTNLSEAWRRGIGIVLFLGLFGLLFLMRYLRALSGWKAVFALFTIMLLLFLSGYQGGSNKVQLYFLGVLGIVLLIILPGGILGYGISWLFIRERKVAMAQVTTTLSVITKVFAIAFVFFCFSVVFFGFTLGLAGAGAGTGAVAVAFGGAFAIAFAGAFAGAFAIAGAIVGAIVDGSNVAAGYAAAAAITIAIAIVVLYQNIKIRDRTSCFWLIYLALALWLGLRSVQNLNLNTSVLYLFWLIFPLLNVPLDWLSLGVTRGLLQSICSGTHKGGRGFLWALADLGIAFVLLLLMATILLTAVQFANDLRLSVGKDKVMDLVALLQGMETNGTNPDFYWIYFMLFSTLLPTLVHFAVAGASVVLWFPAKIRHELVIKWQNDADKKLEIWFYVSIMPVLGFVIAPTVLLYSLWLLISSFGFGTGLINFFQFFIES